MHKHFDPILLSDPSFKEDSVREVIIAPMLARLGYHPIGDHVVIRSKPLVHPFIYVGTRRHPVTIIPDYTLCSKGRPLLVLDAKSPIESVDSRPNVQQAYSYAIHPEIRTQHFALCNGRRLVLYNVDCSEPLLDLKFEQFESHWEQIEKHLGPKYLLEPGLRKFAPDFGLAISRTGFDPTGELTLIGARLNLFARISDTLYTATVNTSFSGRDHCASFDFSPEKLPLLVAGLPSELREQFLQALARAPFQAAADLHIEVDITTHLGEPIDVEHESFIPLVIEEVLSSRFNTAPPSGDPGDIPSEVYRLSKAFKIALAPT
jgi:hypothetical protein